MGSMVTEVTLKLSMSSFSFTLVPQEIELVENEINIMIQNNNNLVIIIFFNLVSPEITSF